MLLLSVVLMKLSKIVCPYLTWLPPFGHIWVLLLWRKGNINRTISVPQYCLGRVPLQWCTMVWTVLTGQLCSCAIKKLLTHSVDWIGLWSCFSSLSSKCLCIFGFHGAPYTGCSKKK